MPSKLEPVQIRTGQQVGDIPALIDVGAGTPGFDAIDGSLLRNVGSTGIPGEIAFGNRLNYVNAQGSLSSGLVQYVRVKIAAGLTIAGMQTFIANASGGTKNIRMGLYGQADPTTLLGVPTTKLAETGVRSVASTSNLFVFEPFISGNYVIPTTGYYWLAIVQDSSSISYAIAPGIHPGFLPSFTESSTGTTLPATVGTLNASTGPLVFVSGIET